MLKKSFLVLFSVILGLAFFVPQSASAAMNRNAQKEYDYELIDQQPQGIITMQPGEIKTVWIEVKNTGTKMWRTWNADPSAPVRLGTGSKYDTQNRGYNYSSSFYADPASDGHFDIDSWSSNNRIYTMTDGVRSTWYIQPGWNTRFQFKIQAPTTPGTYKEYFTPVADGITWMKDVGIYWGIRVLDSSDIPYSNQLLSRQNTNGLNILTPTNNEAIFNNRSIVTYKLKTGDRLMLKPPYVVSKLDFDDSIISHRLGSDGLTHIFDVIKDGYSKISFEYIDDYGRMTWYSAFNIVANRNHYFYDKGSDENPSINNVKAGDIVIVRLPNPGDGGYVFGEPEFPSPDRVKLLDHTHFAVSAAGLMGDFGEDQWAFEILDSGGSNWIQIISYRPWEYQKYDMSTYTKVFGLYMNPMMACGSQYNPC